MSVADAWSVDLGKPSDWAPGRRTLHIVDHPEGGKAWVVVQPIPDNYLARSYDLAPIALRAINDQIEAALRALDAEHPDAQGKGS